MMMEAPELTSEKPHHDLPAVVTANNKAHATMPADK